jgi:hypothetical protein
LRCAESLHPATLAPLRLPAQSANPYTRQLTSSLRG